MSQAKLSPFSSNHQSSFCPREPSTVVHALKQSIDIQTPQNTRITLSLFFRIYLAIFFRLI